MTERVAQWSAGHPKTAVIAWFALLVVLVLAGGRLGGDGRASYDPGENGQAQRMKDGAAASLARPAENVLVTAPSGFAAGGEGQAAVDQLVTGLRALSAQVTDVIAPNGERGAGLRSADGGSVLVPFTLTGAADDDRRPALTAVGRVLDQVRGAHPGVRVVQAGDASVKQALDDAAADDFRRAETTSLPLTLIILLVVFGALVAAGIPLLLAGTSVVGALSILAIVGRWVPVASTAASVVLLIGMAVGIDYALFYLRREREERLAGRSTAEAVRIAARTSGRAIVTAGLTVMVCVAALWFTGMDAFKGMALGTVAVVGYAVLGSLTVLPGLLTLLGRRVDAGRIPWLGKRRTTAGDSRFWGSLAERVVRRPLLWGFVAVLLLGVLAFPALGLRIANPGLQDELPSSNPTIAALTEIQAAFPGGPQPAQIVVTGDVTQAGMTAAVEGLHRQAAASGGTLREPITAVTAADGGAMIIKVPLAGAGTDRTSQEALDVLRGTALPATLGQLQGIEYAVGGETAANHDFNAALASRIALVVAIVFGFALLLLIAAFRSATVAIASVLLNLLSIGAAYGVVTWVFQDGHLSGALGFTPYGGVISWLPLFMFVVLFGLSMDYHVFILSRIRELRLGGEDADPRMAVVRGIRTGAGVVTSAATIMVGVFAIFATLSNLDYKMLGVGMAVAIAIDATVVRGILLPATLSLLIRRVWRPTPAAAAAPAAAADATADSDELPEPGEPAHAGGPRPEAQ